jgi:putative NADPH-quinone reductase
MNNMTRVLVLNGHPDNQRRHLIHALADAYIEGAKASGHEVRTIDVASLDFPLLRSKDEWEHGTLPPSLNESQAAIGWAEHLLVLFPLWLGGMPALLKGFLEQVARPGFAFKREADNPFAGKALGGRSARIVVTMGMPALLYRWYFRAHSVRALERNILGFVGIAPIHETLIGLVDTMDASTRRKWMSKLRAFGRAAT